MAEGFQRRRLKCEKLTDDRRRTPSDGKSSHCLWQGELKLTDQCYIKYIMMLPIKTIISVLKVSTNTITARAIALAAIATIMSVSIFKTVIILYMLCWSVLMVEKPRVPKEIRDPPYDNFFASSTSF